METGYEVWEFLIWLATFAFFAVLAGYALIGLIPEERDPRKTSGGAMRAETEGSENIGPSEEGHTVEEPYRRAA